jgi:hypothetical protein
VGPIFPAEGWEGVSAASSGRGPGIWLSDAVADTCPTLSRHERREDRGGAGLGPVATGRRLLGRAGCCPVTHGFVIRRSVLNPSVYAGLRGRGQRWGNVAGLPARRAAVLQLRARSCSRQFQASLSLVLFAIAMLASLLPSLRAHDHRPRVQRAVIQDSSPFPQFFSSGWKSSANPPSFLTMVA